MFVYSKFKRKRHDDVPQLNGGVSHAEVKLPAVLSGNVFRFLPVEDRDHTGEQHAVSAFSEFLYRGKKKGTLAFTLSAPSYNI